MRRSALIALAALTLVACGQAGPRITEVSFARKALVQMRLPDAEVRLRTSKDADIHVRVESPGDADPGYEPVWTDEPQLLLLADQSEPGAGASALWIVSVPPGTTVEFEGDSGAFDADGFDGALRASSASGAIAVVRARGSFDLRNGSGEIRFTGPTLDSTVHAETSSGAITLEGFRGSFDLHSASGAIIARMAFAPTANLLMESSSGSVTLDYAGLAVAGTIEIWNHQSRGTAVSPWTADREELINDGGDVWIRRSYEHGLLPNVKLKSASGTAEVRL